MSDSSSLKTIREESFESPEEEDKISYYQSKSDISESLSKHSRLVTEQENDPDPIQILMDV